MAASDYNIIVEVLARSDAFLKTLKEAEQATQRTADNIVAHAERAQQRFDKSVVRTNEVIAAQQREIVGQTNKEVQAELRKMGESNKKVAEKAGASLGSGFMNSFMSKIAAGVGVGLVVSSFDDLLEELNDRAEGKGNEAGLGFMASMYERITGMVGKLPIFGQLMRGAGNLSQALIGATQTTFGGGRQLTDAQIQENRAKEMEENARRQRRLAKERQGMLEYEQKMQEEAEARSKAFHEWQEAALRRQEVVMKKIHANRKEALEREEALEDRMTRLQIEAGENSAEQLRLFEQHVELRELNAEYEERIKQALEEGLTFTAGELEKQRERLIVLTQQAQAMEDQAAAAREQEERLQKARETADAYLEVEELVAQTRLQAQAATSTFDTAGGSFVTQASVGAMNEQKLANKLSQRSIDILTEIEGNTRNAFEGMDLA